MAKFSGNVGFTSQEETRPGVWEEVKTERTMRGDVLSLAMSVQSGDKVIDDINLNNRISLVADKYSYENFHNLKYIVYLGGKWKVTNVDVQRPRLILTLGGVWNE